MEAVKLNEIPNEIVSPLVYICKFVYTFSGKLNLTWFSAEQLYGSLDSNNNLLSELHMALLKPVCMGVFEDPSFILRNYELKFLCSVHLLNKILDINTYLPFCWKTLLGELILSDTLRDHCQEVDSSVFGKLKFNTLDAFYLRANKTQKLQIIKALILKLKSFQEFQNVPINKKELSSEYAEKLRSLEKLKDWLSNMQESERNTNKYFDCISRIKKLKARKEELEKLMDGSQSFRLGVDDFGIKYYYFDFQPDQVLAKTKKQTPSGMQKGFRWYNFKEVQDYIQRYSPKRPEHKKLIQAFTQIIKKSPQPQTLRYANLLSDFISVELSFKAIKGQICSYQKRVNSKLDLQQEDNWKQRVKDEKTPSGVAKLLLEKANNFTAQNAIQKTPNFEDPFKTQKVSLSLWSYFEGYQVVFSSLVECLKSEEHLALVFFIYEALTSQLLDSVNFISAPQRPLQQPINLVHDDLCFYCGAKGRLLECNECTVSAHVECAGLKRFSKKWTCQNCKRTKKVNYS